MKTEQPSMTDVFKCCFHHFYRANYDKFSRKAGRSRSHHTDVTLDKWMWMTVERYIPDAKCNPVVDWLCKKRFVPEACGLQELPLQPSFCRRVSVSWKVRLVPWVICHSVVQCCQPVSRELKKKCILDSVCLKGVLHFHCHPEKMFA